jgi:putative endonuclease
VDSNPDSAAPRDPRHSLGRCGEELASTHLRRRGLRVLARNVRTPRGEIDLIAFDPAAGTSAGSGSGALVFVEVKTRRTGGRAHAGRDGGLGAQRPREDQLPLAGLGTRQQARLRRLAAAWLADRRHVRPSAATIRFDAVGVLLDPRGRLLQIEHVEDAW